MSRIAANLNSIKEDIFGICQKCGRDPDSVSLMAVSKNNPVDAVVEAIEAGQVLFGENRVQEAKEKFSNIHDNYNLHMIGHLQRNKVKDAVEICNCVQSVDAIRTADKIASLASASGKDIDVLIEVNTSGETSKSGVSEKEELKKLVEHCTQLKSIKLSGLMTMAPFTPDESEIRKSFVMLRTLFEYLGETYELPNWQTLSMGMSSDYKIAIEEGSTLVRIGTAIFGSRN